MRVNRHAFLEHMEVMRVRPSDYVTCVSPRALGAWVYGYGYVDESVATIWRSTARHFSGPDCGDAATRSLLLYATDTLAFYALVSALINETISLNLLSKPSAYSGKSWIDASKDHLLTRPGMVLGDSLVVNLTHQIHGYLNGLDDIYPERGIMERLDLKCFQDFLRNKHNSPLASWGNILRVFYAEDRDGVSAFVRLWDEFNRTVLVSGQG